MGIGGQTVIIAIHNNSQTSPPIVANSAGPIIPSKFIIYYIGGSAQLFLARLWRVESVESCGLFENFRP